jgi:hypothetical protein
MPSRASSGGGPHPPDRRDVRRRDPAVPWQAATGPLRDARIVLRERPEAVEAGYAKVMGFEAIWAEMEARASEGRPSREHPYGTGDAAKKIVDVLEGFLEK